MRYQEPRIFFDSAAAARPHPRLAKWYAELLPVCSVNPHGGTCYAERARRIVLEAACRLLRLLHIPDGEADVIWTSGITEALNLAATLAKGTVLVDPTAHASLTAPLARCSAACMPFMVQRDGKLAVSCHSFASLEGESGAPSLAAISHVNNETGVLQDVCALRTAVGPSTQMLLDCAQSFCKCDIPWREAHLGAVALSSRKIGGPASVGALVIRKTLVDGLRPELVGGGQQKGIRSGTMDVCGIEMFVRAAEDAVAHLADYKSRLLELNRLYDELLDGFASKWKAVKVGETEPDGAIHLLHLPGYEGAVVSRILAEEYGVLVASSSACSAEHGSGSTSMRAMGFSEQQAKEAIRISFDIQNTPDELRELFQVLNNTLSEF
ncbi:MAG: aminotransferase class V-fold PLP-dependent enzyme [Victivallales bacterium]|nr:aminotransferase class V-fold PLP-dependent enzyme [Victivallales bacterium]